MKKKLTISSFIILLIFTLSSCQFVDELIKGYRVSFYSDNELIKEIYIKAGEPLIEPSLTKEEYDLVGWYKDLNDLDTKWDFNNDKVSGHLKLTALWELKENFVSVENVRLENNLLYFDVPDDTLVNVSFNNEKIDLLVNYFDLSLHKELLETEQELTFKAIKDGYSSVETVVKVKYNQSEIIETYRIDFEAFDDSSFKELNRASFLSSLIDYDDFHLYINEGRLTKENESPKNNSVSLILRKEGYIQIKEAFNSFEKLEFLIGSFQNRATTSKLSLYVSNDEDNWQLYNQFSLNTTAINPFKSIIVTKENISSLINIENPIYFKLEANIADVNIVVEDIVIYEKIAESYSLTQINNNDFELLDYYQSAQGLVGKELIEELRIIVSTNLNPVRYKDIKEILEFADAHPNLEDRVLAIYDRNDYKANWGSRSEWHREHVWPNSRLGMDRVKENEVNQGSDPHNLRAIQPSVNSSRSNRYFVEKKDDLILGHTVGKDGYYPGDDDKGDVARILMYMVIRYEILGLTNHLSLLNKKAYTIDAAYMGILSNLLTWHLEDSVDSFEKRRNEIIYEYQNNRNPFIDHPEFFELVYNYLIELDSNRTVTSFINNILYLDSYFKRVLKSI